MKICQVENFFNTILADDDKERAFYNIIKTNMNGFAPKRSLKVVKTSLYRWFKKFLGVDIYDLGIIYIQNIVLNNADVFDMLFHKAIKEYIPVKEKDVQKRKIKAEIWNENWEIADNRNYNPNTYKAFDFELSLYKTPQDKKVYLESKMSEIERKFIKYIDKHKDKIVWWWKNGDEHMALNFGIKYGDGSTFQPDYLILYKSEKLGIYDTKGAGFQEDDTKVKAEALQRYIKEENKKKGKNILQGGIVISEGKYFMINSDEEYSQYNKNVMKVKDKKNGDGRGWEFFEL